jgi:hypothetical protein
MDISTIIKDVWNVRSGVSFLTGFAFGWYVTSKAPDATAGSYFDGTSYIIKPAVSSIPVAGLTLLFRGTDNPSSNMLSTATSFAVGMASGEFLRYKLDYRVESAKEKFREIRRSLDMYSLERRIDKKINRHAKEILRYYN